MTNKADSKKMSRQDFEDLEFFKTRITGFSAGLKLTDGLRLIRSEIQRLDKEVKRLKRYEAKYLKQDSLTSTSPPIHLEDMG